VSSVAVGEDLYTGSWDKTIKVWNIEVRAIHAVTDIDSGMSLYIRGTYGFCQVIDNRLVSGDAVIRLHRCVPAGMVDERRNAVAHTQGTFSSD